MTPVKNEHDSIRVAMFWLFWKKLGKWGNRVNWFSNPPLQSCRLLWRQFLPFHYSPSFQNCPSNGYLLNIMYLYLTGVTAAFAYPKQIIARPPHQPPVILSGTPEVGLAPLTCGCWPINSISANIGHRNSIRNLNQYPFWWNILIRS